MLSEGVATESDRRSNTRERAALSCTSLRPSSTQKSAIPAHDRMCDRFQMWGEPQEVYDAHLRIAPSAPCSVSTCALCDINR